MSSRLRITRLVLLNWKNFARVEVDLQRRMFLVGPNASGKSNLLDAIRFLRDLAAVGGGFEEAVRVKRGGVSAIRCLAARRQPEVGITASLGSDEEPASWVYELRLRQDKQRRPLLSRERVSRGDDVLLDRPEQEDEDDPERLRQTHLEQINVNKPFREVAEFFRSVRYLHIVPQLVREPDRSVGKTLDPFGGDFIHQIADTSKRTREARLRRIVKALQVAVPQLTQLVLEPDVQGAPHLKGRYEHWRAQGAWQREDQLSDGTLRLLGLLRAVIDGTGPLLLEEPELSLHPEIVRHLPQLFARIQGETGRQILLSTHSPELLLEEGIGLDEVLLLVPGREGTSVRPASSYEEVPHLLAGGLTLAEAVLPRTAPERAAQLSLFGGI